MWHKQWDEGSLLHHVITFCLTGVSKHGMSGVCGAENTRAYTYRSQSIQRVSRFLNRAVRFKQIMGGKKKTIKCRNALNCTHLHINVWTLESAIFYLIWFIYFLKPSHTNPAASYNFWMKKRKRKKNESWSKNYKLDFNLWRHQSKVI